MVNALGGCGDEGRGVAAISLGEVRSNRRSQDFRMGKPGSTKSRIVPPEHFLGEAIPGEVKHLSTRRKRNQKVFS